LLERLRVWWRVAQAQGKMVDGGWQSCTAAHNSQRPTVFGQKRVPLLLSKTRPGVDIHH